MSQPFDNPEDENPYEIHAASPYVPNNLAPLPDAFEAEAQTPQLTSSTSTSRSLSPTLPASLEQPEITKRAKNRSNRSLLTLALGAIIVLLIAGLDALAI
jgi:hypothetical protein